jgi:choline-sulfatase
MNVLVIMTDEHRKDAMGCAGHPIVKTPNMDALAKRGIRFTNAYCNSPICIPSRASFAAGRYVNEIENWDNTKPYQGEQKSWGHHLSENGVSVTTIGKLDFLAESDDGFKDQRFAQHRQLPGDIEGLHRDPVRKRADGRDRITEAGDGDFWIEDTEKETLEAERFLREEAPAKEQPWVLWLNYLPPHFPLIAPKKYYDMYPEDEMDLPFDSPSADGHPILNDLRYHFDAQNVDEKRLRKTRSAYYGLCTFIDDYIGRVLKALRDSGLEEDTLIIYTSDHGEPLGDHDLWWKCNMYEESVGIPLIVAGKGLPQNVTNHSPVSLVDITSTISEAVGVRPDSEWKGKSILPLLPQNKEESDNRLVFSEYHAHGTSHGMFMIRKGKYKYVYYPQNPEQLFDLEDDPQEMKNLAEASEYAQLKEQLYKELLSLVQPDEVDRKALSDQKSRLQKYLNQ